MLFTDTAFIGIDPASSVGSFTYAALDKDLNLIALANGEMDEVTAFAAGQRAATVAVNSPAGANRGLAREAAGKPMLAAQKTKRGAEMRAAEHQLRQRGILISGTPSSAALAPAWMKSGFGLYRRLAKLGFKKYPDEAGANYQVLETNSHASFCALLGHLPLGKSSLEGRLQRQLILYERGLKIRDPMDFFEEITRHKIMKGAWPLDLLYLPEQLDAMSAAYTAWLAARHPEKVSAAGDAREGWITLPAAELKEKYSL